MFQEHCPPWEFTSIRRYFRVPIWAYLETIFLGRTVYFAFLPRVETWLKPEVTNSHRMTMWGEK